MPCRSGLQTMWGGKAMTQTLLVPLDVNMSLCFSLFVIIIIMISPFDCLYVFLFDERWNVIGATPSFDHEEDETSGLSWAWCLLMMSWMDPFLVISPFHSNIQSSTM
jgi:hypothetical protein